MCVPLLAYGASFNCHAFVGQNFLERPGTNEGKKGDFQLFLMNFADVTQTTHTALSPSLRAELCGGERETWRGPDLSSAAPSRPTAEV